MSTAENIHADVSCSPRAASTPVSRLIPAVTLVVAALLWSYWPTIVLLWQDWQSDDNYSVGQLVPFAALYLLWHDRKALAACPIRVCWWGAGLILVAQAGRAFGLLFLYESAERYSLVLTVAGSVLLAAGWAVSRRVVWILVFLLLMVPLPGRVHNAISAPLQTQATTGAVFLLELLGVLVEREGHVLLLDGRVPMAVAEACSGLRMLTAFVVVGYVLAYLVRRPRWQKVVLVLSTVPIAIVCNLVRLVITGFLFLKLSSEAAERFFHDFAGWTMMPMAFALMFLELVLMAWIVVPEDRAASGPAGDAAAV
jgi:exosortase